MLFLLLLRLRTRTIRLLASLFELRLVVGALATISHHEVAILVQVRDLPLVSNHILRVSVVVNLLLFWSQFVP